MNNCSTVTTSTNGLMAAGEVTKELKKTKSGLRILARLDSHSSPFLLDEPHWIPDNEVCDSNMTVLDVFLGLSMICHLKLLVHLMLSVDVKTNEFQS